MIVPLVGGDIAAAPPGTHLVLESARGSLLHGIRLTDGEGILALRAGQVSRFQVVSCPPRAAMVLYPPPFGADSEWDRQYAVERARGLLHLSLTRAIEHLTQSGADAAAFPDASNACNTKLVEECMATFCATGAARSWGIKAAYEAAMSASVTAGADPTRRLMEPEPPSRPSGAHSNSFIASATPSHQQFIISRESQDSTALPQGERSLVANGPAATVTQRDGRSGTYASVIPDKICPTAVHVALRSGPAARVAGVAATVGVEGYELYKSIGEHYQRLNERTISGEQCQERILESVVSSSSRAAGGLAGAAVGQAAIPIPVVGALLGGVVGAACGGYHATSFVRGSARLAGSKAKGGDDLVRCVEHQPGCSGDPSTATAAAAFPDPARESGTPDGEDEMLL